MNYTQVVNPLGNLGLSALVASIPTLFIFWALIIRKMKGFRASLFTAAISIAVAVIVYGMPVKTTLLSFTYGALYGLLPICWIIIGAVFLFNATIKSGQFEIIRSFIASITPDRRLQAILIAFSFGAFLEGATGFGAPIAISAAMLLALGFNPLYAAGLCLIANTAPVAFGAIGTPIITAAKVSDIPELAISQLVGRTLPILSVVIPLYLVVLMAGIKRSMEVLPAILVSGITFAFFQWYSSNYLGPMLPDVVAGLASIISLIVLLKFWKPKTIWRFKDELEPSTDSSKQYSNGETARAWTPFIIMTLVVVAWGLAPVKAALDSLGHVKFDIPGLSNSILQSDGHPLLIKPFEFNFLSTPGTGLLIAGIISLPFIGMNVRQGVKTYLETLKQLKYPIITVASVVGFAFVATNSGMSLTMAMALSGTGFMLPFFSPMLGWLGVFLTGSDTSSNALFCKLQYDSAKAIGIDPLVTVSANASGGVTGKMISPQSIAIGAAAVGLVGKEAQLFRFTVKHSFIMLIIICIITFLQAYVFIKVIPKYKKISAIIPTNENISKGFAYIIGLTLIILLLGLLTCFMNRKKKAALPVTVS